MALRAAATVCESVDISGRLPDELVRLRLGMSRVPVPAADGGMR